MSQYRIYVHQKGKLANCRERGIYVDKRGQLYLQRLLANGQDHFQSHGTNQIHLALERREAVRKCKIEAELGIAEDPEKAAKKAKATVPKVIRRYLIDGFPDKKPNLNRGQAAGMPLAFTLQPQPHKLRHRQMVWRSSGF